MVTGVEGRIEFEMLDNISWVDVIPAGFAMIILIAAMVMLVSGIWASRDQ